MLGCRSLKDSEIAAVLTHLTNTRDKTLFLLGCKSGFRIQELLSLKVSDVYRGSILDRMEITRKNTKGKSQGQSVLIHPAVKPFLSQLILEYSLKPTEFLFKSEKGENQAINRVWAWRVLKAAYNAAGLQGKVACHSMRKSYAKRIYELSDKDLLITQKALRHKSILSTISYLDVEQETVDNLISKV